MPVGNLVCLWPKLGPQGCSQVHKAGKKQTYRSISDRPDRGVNTPVGRSAGPEAERKSNSDNGDTVIIATRRWINDIRYRAGVYCISRNPNKYTGYHTGALEMKRSSRRDRIEEGYQYI